MTAPPVPVNMTSAKSAASRPTERSGLAVLVGEAVRYGVTAIVALAADVTVFLIAASGLGLDIRVAAAAGFAVGLLVNYALSVLWVFRVRAVRSRLWEFAVFAAIGLIGLGMTVLLVDGLAIRLGLRPGVAKAIAVMLVFGWNFLARKIFLFAAPAKSTPAAIRTPTTLTTPFPASGPFLKTRA